MVYSINTIFFFFFKFYLKMNLCWPRKSDWYIKLTQKAVFSVLVISKVVLISPWATFKFWMRIGWRVHWWRMKLLWITVLSKTSVSPYWTRIKLNRNVYKVMKCICFAFYDESKCMCILLVPISLIRHVHCVLDWYVL